MKITNDYLKGSGLTAIKCDHVVNFEKWCEDRKTDANKKIDATMARPDSSFELEPALLFVCCSWCASRLRENALKDLVKSGIEVTLKPMPKSK